MNKGEQTYKIKQNEFYKDVLKNALNDPTLISQINIGELLKTIETENVNSSRFLINKTNFQINEDIIEALKSNNIPNEKIPEICNKLTEYRFVDEICDLYKGKYVRWISLGSSSSGVINGSSLTNGGIIIDIKFRDNGIHILCKNNINRFIQYNFDDNITFQKLSFEEQTILLCNSIK
jgi:hypothetical protein